MTEEKKKPFALISILFGVLIAIVGVQTYFLVRMEGSIKQIKQESVQSPAMRADLFKSTSPQQTITAIPSKPLIRPAKPLKGLASLPFEGNRDIFEEMHRMQSEVNRFFSNVFGRMTLYSPIFEGNDEIVESGLEVTTDNKQVAIKMHIPNLKEEDLKIKLTDQSIEIQGKFGNNIEEKDTFGNVYRQEWSETFFHAFPLPSRVDPSSLQKTYKDGVLTLSLKEV